MNENQSENGTILVILGCKLESVISGFLLQVGVSISNNTG